MATSSDHHPTPITQSPNQKSPPFPPLSGRFSPKSAPPQTSPQNAGKSHAWGGSGAGKSAGRDAKGGSLGFQEALSGVRNPMFYGISRFLKAFYAVSYRFSIGFHMGFQISMSFLRVFRRVSMGFLKFFSRVYMATVTTMKSCQKKKRI